MHYVKMLLQDIHVFVLKDILETLELRTDVYRLMFEQYVHQISIV